MGISSDIRAEVRKVLSAPWDRRTGQVVPNSEDIKLSGGAVELDAVFLYADMADSTLLAQTWKPEAAAKVIRSFLDASTRVIRSEGGKIRSFDGDRVMGIFVGGFKCTAAARCALKINYAVTEILQDELASAFSDYPSSFRVSHCTGAALGKALLVRGGVRNNNDLVSVGSAPNVAAKLSGLRTGHSSYITSELYDEMSNTAAFSDGRPMWSREFRTIASRNIMLYRSTWVWEP